MKPIEELSILAEQIATQIVDLTDTGQEALIVLILADKTITAVVMDEGLKHANKAMEKK